MTSMAAVLTPHVPYLRRFARALSGSQQSGDAYVVATLEAMIEDPEIFPSEMPHRIGLFHVFLKIWNSITVNGQTPAVEGSNDNMPADRRLENITPRPRQAFLLVALEEFDFDEAALVLGTDEATIRELVDQASREIAEQVLTDVLIIEDEPLIAMDLEDIVGSLGHTIIGIGRTYDEAQAIVKERQPGLILADIQLADGSSGLDAVNDMLDFLDVPVIFITAFPERLLTGQRPEPTFLITKPFQPSTVKAIISQALFFERRAGRKKVA
ncbi:MAG: response regulator [Hyphomicrobiaceae bacterium]|nr:response regulator [Hyphomicrobiaceae bacterium]